MEHASSRTLLTADAGWPSTLHAYITLANAAYIPGVRALAASLADVGARWPLVVIHADPAEACRGQSCLTRDANERRLASAIRCLNATTHPTALVNVPSIVHDEHARLTRFSTTFIKLNAFRAPYASVVVVDADLLVLRNLDELFDLPFVEDALQTNSERDMVEVIDMATGVRSALPKTDDPARAYGADDAYASLAARFHLHAATELGWGCHTRACHMTYQSGTKFNTGVMALRPDATAFAAMLRALQSVPSSDGGDQGFLNEYFLRAARAAHGANATLKGILGHTPLPRRYNRMFQLSTVLRPMIANATARQINVSGLHLIGGTKPWLSGKPLSGSDLVGEAQCRTPSRFGTEAADWTFAEVLERYYGRDFGRSSWRS